MQERIHKLITTEKLSPSKFAEIIGVQRSSISHILSGRNKPSFDVLQLILKKFPNVSSDWLILGTGEMHRKPVQASLFENPPQILKEFPIPSTATKVDVSFHETKNAEAPEVERKHIPSKPPENELHEKQVDRVLIFYTDRTFTLFKPG